MKTDNSKILVDSVILLVNNVNAKNDLPKEIFSINKKVRVRIRNTRGSQRFPLKFKRFFETDNAHSFFPISPRDIVLLH